MGTMGDPGGFTTTGERVNPAHVMFDRFTQASTCKGTLKAFQELCDHLDLKPCEYRIFYHKLKSRLNYWKAKALWVKLDKRAGQKEYKKGRACANSKVCDFFFCLISLFKVPEIIVLYIIGLGPYSHCNIVYLPLLNIVIFCDNRYRQYSIIS